jgi:hypothetical protein
VGNIFNIKSTGNDMPILKNRRVSKGLQEKRGREGSLQCTKNGAVVDTSEPPDVSDSATFESFQGAWEQNYPYREAKPLLDASTS